jgi:hypothetical protein
MRFYIGLLATALAGSVQAATINADITGFTGAELRVVHHAVDFWSETILDPFTIDIGLAKLDIAGDLLGASFGFTEDVTGRPTGGTIQIDNRAGSVIGWFVDSTPELNEEYMPGATPWHSYGRRPGSAGEEFDLLTVLHHELAHVFGFSMSYTRFSAAVTPADTPPLRAFTGSTVTALLAPAYEGTHLSDAVHPFDLMTAYQSRGERILPSDLDLAMLSDAFGYSIANREPAAIPEPFSVLLTASGLFALGLLKRAGWLLPLIRHRPGRPQGLHGHVREQGRGFRRVIVRADCETRIRRAERCYFRISQLRQCAAFLASIKRHHVASPLKPQPRGAFDRKVDSARNLVRLLAPLQGCQTGAMHDRVSVSGAGFKVLANNEASLSVRHSATDDLQVGRDDDITGHLPPHKKEIIACAPHVIPAAGYAVLFPLRVVNYAALVRRRAHIGGSLKDPDASGRLRERSGREAKHHKGDSLHRDIS